MTNLQKHPKSGVYRFRRAVPEDLRPILGKTEIVETLDTKDLADAKRRVKEVGLRIDAMFEAARAGRVGITIAEVQQFADAWKAEKLQEDAQARLPMPAFTGTVTASIELFAHQAALEHRVREMTVALDRRDYRSVEPTASSLLARSGRLVDRRTEGYQALCRSLMQVSIDVVREQISRAIGDWSGAEPTSAAPAQPARALPRQSSNTTPISKILDLWVAERRPPAKTEKEWRMAIRRFREVVGSDIAIQDVRKDDVRTFKQALQKMPRVLTANQRKQTVPQILNAVGNLPEEKRLSNVSVNKLLGALSSVLSWAMDNGYIESNPASRVRVSIKSNRKTRIPYDDNDLKLIFGSAIYTTNRARDEPATFWLPLMALWMGAREEELGQATVEDVREEDGFQYLRIDTIEENQSTKNAGSQRSVPIHPQLIRCGFLDYVAALKAKGEKRLFPDLKVSKDGSYTAAWSKKINRIMRRLGITDRRKVFHSFRHNFKDACRRADIQEAVHDALTGHSNGSVGRNYGLGYRVAELAQAMNRITYPALDLSHLEVRRASDPEGDPATLA